MRETEFQEFGAISIKAGRQNMICVKRCRLAYCGKLVNAEKLINTLELIVSLSCTK